MDDIWSYVSMKETTEKKKQSAGKYHHYVISESLRAVISSMSPRNSIPFLIGYYLLSY